MTIDSLAAGWLLERHEAIAAPFPDHWRDILRARVPFYGTFTDGERGQFEAKLKIFVYTKSFGSRDIEAVTEEMKIVIAATACRLTMNMPGEEYGRLRHVGVRGRPFRNTGGDREDDNEDELLGQAGHGKVTVSWPDVLEGLADAGDGSNVGFHEFAHALDASDGEIDGVAPSHHFALYDVWARLVSDGQEVVSRAVRTGVEPPIDAYAGKDEAEFFAVATEWFFERPAALREHFPPVYDLLARFYGQDPLKRA